MPVSFSTSFAGIISTLQAILLLFDALLFSIYFSIVRVAGQRDVAFSVLFLYLFA